ncbi:NAD(P)-dependent oxidoreductase [Sulfurovum riftiae]|uniref:Phosphogluconate dehydrogenase n=1 Tax=Sulfurovum riftiae TaxID=1630136 RepID=A0A151CJB7_9BACT|nr:NAD(P)-dependent oxidoreductase [Sulfurovum riftiae]KYJ87630.1 hypothetical protein AS592_11065 [Sulfurovum riftiae]
MLRNKRVGFLYPGDMGVFLAHSVQNSGYETLWCSEQRSQSTCQRAEQQDMVEVSSLVELCEQSSIIISICPPHAASDVAYQVLQQHFTGIFVEANAISPELSKRLSAAFAKKGVSYVDAAVFGGTNLTSKNTQIFLSGSKGEQIASIFSSGPVISKVISDEIGKASATKMCHSMYSKGIWAMLHTAVSAAEHYGIRDQLESLWIKNNVNFTENTYKNMQRTSKKAWRFSAEMNEISSTFHAAGLPDGFSKASSEVYRRLVKFKEYDQEPDIEEIINTLLRLDEQ